MSISYQWTIMKMQVYPEVDGLTNVVGNVSWRLSAMDGDKNVSTGGLINLEYTPGSPFIAYDQLTQEQVIEWVKSVLGQQQVSNIEADLAKQMSLTAPPLPWVN